MPDMDETLLLSFSDIEQMHWWFATRRRIVEEAIGTDIGPESRIVEIGCGTGYFLERLNQRFPHATVLGVEPSDAAARVARDRGCSVSCGTFEDVATSTVTHADMIIALDVLEHCVHDDTALRSAVAAMTPGGRLILTVPALPVLWSPHDEINAHYRRYVASDLSRLLQDSGLTVDRLTYFNTLLLPIAYVTRAVARITRSRKMTGIDMPPRWVNTALTMLFSVEVHALRHVDLPIGMSILAIAHKPAEVTA
jgi:SAM-dependent methyltransferase